MSDSEESAVDLRSLANVEAPETVTRAFRRFRWRVVLYVLAPVLTAIALLGVFLYITVRPSLDTPMRIQRAAAQFHSNTRYATGAEKVGKFEVVILEAAELRPNLGERILRGLLSRDEEGRGLPVGVHLVVVSDESADSDRVDVSVGPKDRSLLENNIFAGAPRVGSHTGGSRVSEYWLILEPPTGLQEIEMVLVVTDRETGNTKEAGEFSIRRL